MCDCDCHPCKCPEPLRPTLERATVARVLGPSQILTSSGEVLTLEPGTVSPRPGSSVTFERAAAGFITLPIVLGQTPQHRPRTRVLPQDIPIALPAEYSSLELPNYETPQSVRCDNGLEFEGVFRIDHLQKLAWLRPTALLDTTAFATLQPTVLGRDGNPVQMSYTNTGRDLVPPYPGNVGTATPSVSLHFQEEPGVASGGEYYSNISGFSKVYLQLLSGSHGVAAQSTVFRRAETRVELEDGTLTPSQPFSSTVTVTAQWRDARIWALGTRPDGTVAPYSGPMRAQAEWQVIYQNAETGETRPGRPSDDAARLIIKLVGAWLFMQDPGGNWLAVAPYYTSGGAIDPVSGQYQALYQPGNTAFTPFNSYNRSISEWASYCPVPTLAAFLTHEVGGVMTYTFTLTFSPNFSRLRVPVFTGNVVDSAPEAAIQKTGYRSVRVGAEPYLEQHNAEFPDANLELDAADPGWTLDGEGTDYWTLIRMPPLPGPSATARSEGTLRIGGRAGQLRISVRGGLERNFSLTEVNPQIAPAESEVRLSGYFGHPDSPLGSAILRAGVPNTGYSGLRFIAAWHPWRDALEAEWQEVGASRPRTYRAFVRHLEAGRSVPLGPLHGLSFLSGTAYSRLPFSKNQLPFLLPLLLERLKGGLWVEDPLGLSALQQIPEGYHTGRWFWPDDRKKTTLDERFRLTYAMPEGAYHPSQSVRFGGLNPIVLSRALSTSSTNLPVGADWTRPPIGRGFYPFRWPQIESPTWTPLQRVTLEFALSRPLTVSQWALFLG